MKTIAHSLSTVFLASLALVGCGQVSDDSDIETNEDAVYGAVSEVGGASKTSDEFAVVARGCFADFVACVRADDTDKADRKECKKALKACLPPPPEKADKEGKGHGKGKGGGHGKGHHGGDDGDDDHGHKGGPKGPGADGDEGFAGPDDEGAPPKGGCDHPPPPPAEGGCDHPPPPPDGDAAGGPPPKGGCDHPPPPPPDGGPEGKPGQCGPKPPSPKMCIKGLAHCARSDAPAEFCVDRTIECFGHVRHAHLAKICKEQAERCDKGEAPADKCVELKELCAKLPPPPPPPPPGKGEGKGEPDGKAD